MKIRSDFVTNSSSVSYILTMNEKLANDMKDWFTVKGSEEAVVYGKLKELIKQGKEISIEGRTVFTKQVKFHTNDIITHDVKNFDFQKLSDEDLMLYIYGEYILLGKVSKLGVFGATLSEHY